MPKVSFIQTKKKKRKNQLKLNHLSKTGSGALFLSAEAGDNLEA